MINLVTLIPLKEMLSKKILLEKFYSKTDITLLSKNISLTEDTKTKLTVIINQLDEDRKNFLILFEEKCKSSIIAFIIALLIYIILSSSETQILRDQFNHILKSYNNWWNDQPKYISFFLPSELIYNILLGKRFIIFAFLILFIRAFLPVFQYRRDHPDDSEFYNFIINDYMANELTSSESVENSNFYNAFSLPSYDGKIFSHFAVKCENLDLAYADFYLNDEMANYRPKVIILSAIIANMNIKNPKPNFYVKSTESSEEFLKGTESYNPDQQELILNLIQNYKLNIFKNKHINEKLFLDDKIANFLKKKKKDYDQNICNSIQYSLLDNNLFAMIPLERNLFYPRSVFSSPILVEDILYLCSIIESLVALRNLIEEI